MAEFIQKGGTNGGSYAKYFTGKLSVWENWYDIASNSSNVGYKLELISGSSGRFSGYGANYSVTIDGSIVASGHGSYSSQSYNTAQTIAEGTITIYHNPDGSKKNMACSAVLDFASGAYSPGDFTPSGTMDLTTIPRASKITAVDANIESATTININRAVSTFKHTITYAFEGLSGTIATKTSDTSVGFQIPASFYEKIPNSKTGTVTLTCTTYNDDTVIGTSTTTFTVTASEEKCKPDILAVLIDSNETTTALTGDNSKLIKYKSTAKITPTATAKNGATIKSITVNGYTVNGSYIAFENAQSEIFTVIATDSRGYTSTLELNPTIISYIPLTTTAKFDRLSSTSSEVKVKYSGNYYNGSFGNANNTLEITWAYREKGSNSWTSGGTLTATIKDNTFSGEGSLGKIFNYKKAYDFILYVSDKLSAVSPQESIKKGEPYFDYGTDSNGKNYLNINGEYFKYSKKIDTEIQIKTGKEYATNEYIDGKRVYIKQLEFNDTVRAGLDNRLVKSHGIVGAEKIWVDLSNSYIKATTTNATYPLPVILYSGNISALSIIVDLTNIYMEAQGGWGTIWTKVIRLKYTKSEEV